MHLELIYEQRTIEQQLHQVLLLRFGHQRVVVGRRLWDKVSLAGLLLDDDCFALVGVQEVQSALYAQHVAEECGLQGDSPCVVPLDALLQVVAYQLLDVGLLGTCVLIEGLGLLACLQTFASQHLQRMMLEELRHAVGKGNLPAVYRIVEKLPSEVSQMDMLGVGLRLQTVDEAHKGRLGIGFKAGCHRGHIHQVIRLVDDELGHAKVILEAYTYQVDLRAGGEYLLQIAPVTLAVAGQEGVALVVAHFQQLRVLLLLGLDDVLIHGAYNAADEAQVVAFPAVGGRFAGEVGLQLGGNSRTADEEHQRSGSLQMLWEVPAQLGGRGFVLRSHFPESLAREVEQRGVLGCDAALLDDIIQFGEQTREGE